MKLPNRKLTPEDLESFVAQEYYFTASQGCKAAGYLPLEDAPASLWCMTFCVLVMTNGYILTGQSACADPRDFNAKLGQELARADAIEKMWPLLGFMRRDQLHEEKAAPQPNEVELRILTKAHTALRNELAKFNDRLNRSDLTEVERERTKALLSEMVDESEALWVRRRELGDKS